MKVLKYKIFSKKEKVILDEVSLLNEGSKGTSFAMYYETQQEDGTYTYVESEDTTWPTDLKYNDKKSGCIDYNGNKIDGTITNNLGSNLGGLIGRDNGTASNTTIIKSHNYGKIKIEKNEATNETYVGGIVGYELHQTKTISNSYNTSNIVVQSETTSDDWTNVEIIGRQSTAGTISKFNKQL